MAPPDPTTGTVLLVDDEFDLVEVAASYLLQSGYAVLRAADGPSALQLFEDHFAIDILVADVLMPGGMSGVDLARSVHRLSPATRILFTSGYSEHALAQKDLSLDGSILLRKPYRLADLGAAIQQALQTPPPEDTPPTPLARI